MCVYVMYMYTCVYRKCIRICVCMCVCMCVRVCVCEWRPCCQHACHLLPLVVGVLIAIAQRPALMMDNGTYECVCVCISIFVCLCLPVSVPVSDSQKIACMGWLRLVGSLKL